MKTNLLSLIFLTIFCICVSATTNSLSKKDNHAGILSDTTKSFESEADSIQLSAEEAWRQWLTVENHTFGKDRGNLPMIADPGSLHPYFRDKIFQLIRNCKKKGIELAVVESYRTHAKQSEYFKMGRKYTRSTGGKSKHQYGLAIDVVPVLNGKAIWENTNLWRKIGLEGERLGLRWGGRWRSPYDPAHFEWSGGLTMYQLAAGALPVIPRSLVSQYPCIEEDIDQLKTQWETWEDYQLALKNSKIAKAVSTAASEKP